MFLIDCTALKSLLHPASLEIACVRLVGCNTRSGCWQHQNRASPPLSRPALPVLQAEWLDLSAEVDAGRLCWTTYLPGHKPKEVIKPKPEPKPEPKSEPKPEASRPPQPAPCSDIIPAMAQPAPSLPDQPPVSRQQHSGSPQIPQRQAAIGHRVAIWWEGDQIWYHGSIKGYTEEGCKHLIYYDDGEMEYLDLSTDRVFWKDLPGRVISPLGSSMPEDALATAEPLLTATAADGMLALAAAVDAAAAAAEPAAPAVPKGPVPDTVPIVCNSSRAVFDVKRTMILLGEGRECTPTEFERLAGKGASKKWKASLRVDKGGGVPGPTMGDWLVDAGLDNPKAPRPKAAPAMHAARRQQVARQRFGNQAPKPQGKQVIHLQLHLLGALATENQGLARWDVCMHQCWQTCIGRGSDMAACC